MEIKNKVALVTGGASGLGLALAQALVEKRAQVHVCGRSEKKLNQAQKKVSQGNYIVHQCDVSQSDQVIKLAEDIGGVDILINAAGIYLEKDFDEVSYQEIDQTMAINLLGTMFVTRAFLPYMKAQNEGFIVNVSSTSGLVGRPQQSVYCASKFGVQGFTQALSQELWQTGVFVSGLYPGGMQTDFFTTGSIEKDLSTFMDPAKVAEVIIFTIERDPSMSMNHVIVNRRV